MGIVIGVSLACASTANTYFFINAFLRDKKQIDIKWKILAIIFVCAVRSYISNIYFDNAVINMVFAAMSALFIANICFNVKILWSILSMVFYVLSAACSELIAAFIVTVPRHTLMGEVLNLNAYRIESVILSNLFMIIIIIITSQLRTGKLNMIAMKKFLPFCMLPVISMFFTVQFIISMVSRQDSQPMNEIYMLLGILFFNLLAFILIENLIRENQKSRMLVLLESQSAMQEKHIMQLLENQNQIRRINHDFKQHLDVLRSLCRNKNYAELLDNLDKLADREPVILSVDTGNVMLDAVLSSKKHEAEKNGFDFKLKMNIVSGIASITIDLCSLIGNALDNAIEACMRSSLDKKIIFTEITTNKMRFLCYIKNTIGVAPQQDGEFLTTLKPNPLHHGIGLRSMKHICDSLGGEMKTEFDENYFECWISIPI